MSIEETKFMKPLDLFLQRKRKNGCISPQSRKKFIISPLKCIDINSPIKDSQSSSLNENSDGGGGGRRTPRKGTPSKRIVTPRKTPSKKTPLKEIKNESNRGNRISERSLRTRRTRKNLFRSPEKSKVSIVTIHDENANLEPPKAIEPSSEPAGLPHLPIDWTLRTRLRFTATKNFTNRGIITSAEDASASAALGGCSSFTLSIPIKSSTSVKTTPYPSLPSDSSVSIETSLLSVLEERCFVWSFPYLAGHEVYPRINNRCKVAPISGPTSDDLFIDYCEGLKDLYGKLRKGQCAYFYVCGNSFTALFRAAGVGGFDEIHALITPTPEGFRAKLKEEGIEFTMPILEKEIEQEKLKEKEVADREKNLTDEQRGEENIINLVNDDDASNFLTSLGIDPTESQSQNPKKKKGPMHTFKSTFVMVKGVQTRDLIPFLSNRLVILAKTGSLARVPPTLISPVFFRFSYVNYLAPKYTRFADDSGESFNLDIKGPIIPAMVVNFCDLFRTVSEDFRVYLSNYEYTTQFNNVDSNGKEKEDKKAGPTKVYPKHCGLPDKFLENSRGEQISQLYTIISCEKRRYLLS